MWCNLDSPSVPCCGARDLFYTLKEGKSGLPKHTTAKDWRWDLNLGSLASQSACFLCHIALQCSPNNLITLNVYGINSLKSSVAWAELPCSGNPAVSSSAIIPFRLSFCKSKFLLFPPLLLIFFTKCFSFPVLCCPKNDSLGPAPGGLHWLSNVSPYPNTHVAQ